MRLSDALYSSHDYSCVCLTFRKYNTKLIIDYEYVEKINIIYKYKNKNKKFYFYTRFNDHATGKSINV